MAIGLGVLRLSPQAFWAMTPRELAAAMGSVSSRGTAPTRNALTDLMAAFPDAG